MLTQSYEPIALENSDPQGYIDSNEKYNHIEVVEWFANMLSEVGVSASFVFPEETKAVTIEVTERSPATFSSKTLNESGVTRRPVHWKTEYNIVENLEENYKIQFYDNTIKISVWNNSILDAEKTAYLIEDIIVKKYHFIRKHVDNLNYKGRLIPGFSSAYEDRKLYVIPLIVTFRTSEMFCESNPVIRSITPTVGLV
jgi:hypothetical protein